MLDGRLGRAGRGFQDTRQETVTSQNDRINDLRLRIEVECDRIGISRAELARRIGKTPQSLHDVISRGNMKATLALEISRALEVPMEVLLTPVSEHEYAQAKKAKMDRRRQKRTGTDGEGFFD
jgi:ribosome-binding protein aMBF1 (putative translation factor)